MIRVLNSVILARYSNPNKFKHPEPIKARLGALWWLSGFLRGLVALPPPSADAILRLSRYRMLCRFVRVLWDSVQVLRRSCDL